MGDIASMFTILVGGYYGAGNLGDDAILECILRDMRELCSDLKFIVTSWNPEITSNQHDVHAIHWRDISALVDAGQQSDMIILGGGGLFQDYWGLDPKTYLRRNYSDITAYGSLPLLAKLIGIPCMIYAVGVGPLQSDVALQHTRMAFECCQVATLRDQASFELLKASGISDKSESNTSIHTLADPVFSLQTTEEDEINAEKYLNTKHFNKQTKLLGVALRYWDRPDPELKWVEIIAKGLKLFLCNNENFHILLFPFQLNADNLYTDDGAINKKLFQYLEEPKRIYLIEDQLTPRFAQALIERCSLVLGMRLHSLILGINSGTPVIALPYDPKVTSLVTDAGLNKYSCNTLTPEPDDLADKLLKAIEDRVIISDKINAFRSRSFKAAKKNAQLAYELLNTSARSAQSFVQRFSIEQIGIINGLDQLVSQKSKDSETLKIQLDEIQKQKEEILHQLDDSQKSQTKLHNEVHALLLQIESINVDLTKQAENNQTLQLQLDSAEANLAQHAEKILALHLQLESVQEDLDNQLKNNYSLKLQLGSTEADLEKQSKITKSLHLQLETSRADLEKQSQLSRILGEQLESANLEFEKQSNNYQSLQLELESTKEDLGKQSKVNRTLLTQLDDIYSSNFWKAATLYYNTINNTPLKHFYQFVTSWVRDGLAQTLKKNSQIPGRLFRKFPRGNELKLTVAKLNAKKLHRVAIVTSTFVYDVLYNQRVINLAKFLSNNGWGVIFVAWRWTKDEEMPKVGKEVYKNVFQIPFDMFLDKQEVLTSLIHTNKYFIIEFPHPEFFSAALRLRSFDFKIIYEIIDDWDAFHKAGQAIWFNKSIEKALILNANYLTAVSQPLVDIFAEYRRDIALIPNGFDPGLLGHNHRNIARRRFDGSEVNVGYFGHLTDSWFDWNFLFNVLDLANNRELNLKFHLIGYGEPDLGEQLVQYQDNILLYGRVKPQKLHQYARKWDVAMIPFKSGKLSEAVDPIKIYEYLYFGLPVIVKGINHLIDHTNVYVISNENQFIDALSKLEMVDKRVTHWTSEEQLSLAISEATWENRFTKLMRILENEKWMFL